MNQPYEVGTILQLNHHCSNRGQKVSVVESDTNGSSYVVRNYPDGVQLLTYYANELEPLATEFEPTWLTIDGDGDSLMTQFATEQAALDHARDNDDVVFIAKVTHVVKRHVDIVPTQPSPQGT